MTAVGLLAMASLPALAPSSELEAASTRLVLQVEGRGKIVINLYTQEAPKTTARIMELAQSGFYDNQKFFKVVRQPRPFAVYFGDPNTKTKALDDRSIGSGSSGKTIPYENSGIDHQVGSVGLSLKAGQPGTGDCQFYISLGEFNFLDGQYTVFGQVTKDSLPLLDKLEKGDLVTKVSVQR